MTALSKKRDSKNKNVQWNLSFAGCGFLGLYHAGVCGCIQEYASQLVKNQCVSGASAGSIAATCLLCDVNLGECVQYLMQVVNKAQSYRLGPFDPRFKVTEHLREGLERLLPSNAHIICSGRLHISLTSQATYRNVVVNQFKDRDELIRAILCSSYIPMFSGFVPLSFRGEWMIDGGITNNIIELNSHTITISPFCGDADICPKDDWGLGHLFMGNTSFLINYANMWRVWNIVWPRSPAKLGELTQQGYNDTLKYLVRQGMITCGSHLPHLVFLTVRVKSHQAGGTSAPCIDNCYHCKQVMRRALTSSLPEPILQSFYTHNQYSSNWVTRLIKKRLIRGLRMLLRPVTLPMVVIYRLVTSTLNSLKLLPQQLEPVFRHLSITLKALETAFNDAYTSNLSLRERAARLCHSLSALTILPPPSPRDIPTVSIDSSDSVRVTDTKGGILTEGDETDEIVVDPVASINPFPWGTAATTTTDDEDMTASEWEDWRAAAGLRPDISETELKRLLEVTRKERGESILEELDRVEHLSDVVEVDSISETTFDHQQPTWSRRSSMFSTALGTQQGGDGTGVSELEQLTNTDDLADLFLGSDSRMTWSYRDYEGADELKMFVVVPVRDRRDSVGHSSKRSSAGCPTDHQAAEDGSDGEDCSQGSSLVETDFSLDS